MSTRRAAVRFLSSAAGAQELVDINIAAGVALQRLRPAARARHAILVTAILLALSDLMAIGPVNLGVLPTFHVVRAITGHSVSHSLYRGVRPEHPHVLDVRLPWKGLG